MNSKEPTESSFKTKISEKKNGRKNSRRKNEGDN
jgi:hypothetical protein